MDLSRTSLPYKTASSISTKKYTTGFATPVATSPITYNKHPSLALAITFTLLLLSPAVATDINKTKLARTNSFH